MSQYCDSNCDEYLYDLSGVVHHQGSVNGGHDTALSKRGTSWFNFNDSYTSRIGSEDVDTEAYILFYQRVQSESVKKFSRDINAKLSHWMETCGGKTARNSIVGINRQWWGLFISGISVRDVDLNVFLCKHGNIKVEVEDKLSSLLQPIPCEIWNAIKEKYPNSKAIQGEIMQCKACKVYYQPSKL